MGFLCYLLIRFETKRHNNFKFKSKKVNIILSEKSTRTADSNFLGPLWWRFAKAFFLCFLIYGEWVL